MRIRLIFYGLLITFLNNVSFSQWEFIGPYGGYIQCMVKDSTNRILVGTPFGGIFRSSDFGENWNQIFIDHLNEDVRSLAINQSGHIFAGTDPHGIFRSTDDGITWERLFNLVYDRTVISILIESNGTIFAGTFSGLYRSTDNGTTFTAKSNGITSSSIYSLGAFDNYILAGTAYAGIFRSSDEGDNWEQANSGIDFNNKIVYKIAVSESTKGILVSKFKDVAVHAIYAGVGDKVYITNDFNWGDLSFPGGSVNDIVPRINGGVVATAQGRIYNYNGSTWDQYVNAPSVNYRNIIEDNSGKMMAGTEGLGTIVTADNWDVSEIKVNGMNAVAVAGINYTGGVINVISKHGPVFESDNFGNTWQNKSYNLKQGFSYDIGRNPLTNTTFACNQNGVYRLPANSTTWEETGFFGQKIRFNSQGNVFLFNGSSCFRSQDDGISFPQVRHFTFNFSDAAFDESDNLYAATANQVGIGVGVKFSNDNGLTFSDINNGLGSLNTTAIKYVDLTGFNNTCFKSIVTATSDGKFFTKNNDNTWNDQSDGLPSNFYTKNIAAINYGNGIINTLISNNQLAINNDLDCSFIFMQSLAAIEITTAAYILVTNGGKANVLIEAGPIGFYGTAGSSVLRRNLLATDVNEINNSVPDEFSLSQNYPNPFNPTTTIQFQVPNSSFINLKVYDILGNEVAILVNEEKSQGTYEVIFNASQLSSGIYFYKIQAGSFAAIKKMILLK